MALLCAAAALLAVMVYETTAAGKFASILEPPAVTLLGACGPQFWGAKRDVKEGVPS